MNKQQQTAKNRLTYRLHFWPGTMKLMFVRFNGQVRTIIKKTVDKSIWNDACFKENAI